MLRVLLLLVSNMLEVNRIVCLIIVWMVGLFFALW